MADAVINGIGRVILWLVLLALPCSASAHRLDEYLQSTFVAIEPEGIKLQMNLTPGVAVAGPVLALIDRDGNDVVSTNEAATYAELVRRELSLRLDQRALDLTLTASEFPATEELRGGSGIIQLEFSATPGTLKSGAHELMLENRHQTNVSVYLVNAALPKSRAIKITRQTRNENQSVGQIEFAFQTASTEPPDAKRIVLPLIAALVVLGGTAIIWWRREPPGQSPIMRS